MKKRTIYLMIAVFIICILSVGCNVDKGVKSEFNSMDDYPKLTSFRAESTNKEIIHQDILKKFDFTLLYFWAPWSQKSVSELKNIAKLEKNLPENVNIMTVVLDLQRANNYKAKIKSAKAENLISLISGDQDLKELSDCIDRFPTTIIVDKDGILLTDPIIGIQLDEKDFEKKYLNTINKLLKKYEKHSKENNRK